MIFAHLIYKYYYVFSKATIHGNGKDGIRTFNAETMKIEYVLNDAVSTIQVYTPESQSSIGVTVTESFTVGGSVNSEGELEFELSYTHATAISYSVVNSIVTQSITTNGERKIMFNVEFLDADKNTLNVAPYCGEYVFYSSVVYKISNYNAHLGSNGKDLSYMTVKLTGEICKNTIIDETRSNSITHNYYNSSTGRSL